MNMLTAVALIFWRSKAVAVALLPKKIVLLRKAPEDDVFDEVIQNLLPHVLQAYPQVVHLHDEISRIPAGFHRCVQEVLATRATSLFVVAVVPGGEGGPRGDPIRLYIFTVMHAEPSVARKRRLYRRALFRCHVATSVTLVSLAAGQVAPSSR